MIQSKLMSWREHLLELRGTLLRSLLYLVIAVGLATWQWEFLMRWLQAPYSAIAATRPALEPLLRTDGLQDGLLVAFRVGVIGGAILASPLVLWELWRFIAPGLTPAERRAVQPLVPVAWLLFLAGCAFVRYVLFPPMAAFLLGFSADFFTPFIRAESYLHFLGNLMLAVGVAFELPVLSFVLAKLGLLRAATLSHFRRHAIVLTAIVAALVTPTPDPINMLLLMVPLYVLFEISVLVAWLAQPPESLRPASLNV